MKKLKEFFKDTKKGALAFAMACFLAIAVTGGMVAGCSTAQVQADIQKVIQEIPTAISIAESIITIVSAAQGKTAADPVLVAQATQIAGEVTADLKLASSILAQYQTGLGTAPASVIAELDSAVASAQTNLGSILTALHISNTQMAEAIGFAVAGIQGVLLALESVIPAKAAALFPRVSANLRAIGSAPGALHVSIQSARAVAKSYNGKVKPLFPKAQVAVPAAHVWFFPVPFTAHAAG